METQEISKQTAQNGNELKRVENVNCYTPCVILNGENRKIKFTKGDTQGKTDIAYFSKFDKGEPARPDQIKAILDAVFATYNIPAEALPLYLSVIQNNQFTLERLKFSVNELACTWNETKFGKPKPADLLMFDEADETEPIFNQTEVNTIIRFYVLWYFFPNQKNYKPEEYNKLTKEKKNKVFTELQHADGRYIKNYCGQILYILTEEGEKHKNLIIEILKRPETQEMIVQNEKIFFPKKSRYDYIFEKEIATQQARRVIEEENF